MNGSPIREIEAAPRPLDWTNILLLALVHVAALVGVTVYGIWHGVTLGAIIVGVTFTVLTIFCISAGYHRPA